MATSFVKKAMTPTQAFVMRLVRSNGFIVPYKRRTGRLCYRVLDETSCPKMNLQHRTFLALKSSERIIHVEGCWIANSKKRKN